MLTLVGAKESEEVVVRRVGRKLDRFLAEWERRVREESSDAGLGPQFTDAGTATFNTEETVPRAPMPPHAELRQTQQIPISPAFAEQLGEASRLAQAEQALVRVNVNARTATAAASPPAAEGAHFTDTSDFTQIKSPPVPTPAAAPPPRPPAPPPPPPPPPPKSLPKAPTSDALESVGGADPRESQAPALSPAPSPSLSTNLSNNTPDGSQSIPQESEASFSEMPASQIFAHGPAPSSVRSGGRGFSLGVFAVVLQPAFLVSLLLTGAILLFAYAMLGGEEFLP